MGLFWGILAVQNVHVFGIMMWHITRDMFSPLVFSAPSLCWRRVFPTNTSRQGPNSRSCLSMIQQGS